MERNFFKQHEKSSCIVRYRFHEGRVKKKVGTKTLDGAPACYMSDGARDGAEVARGKFLGTGLEIENCLPLKRNVYGGK